MASFRDTKPFDGKVALVTGGTSGIGRATALAFGRQGATVAVVGRDAERGREVVDLLRKEGGAAGFIRADLSDPVEPGTVVPAVQDRFGRLDIAFNNAGYLEERGLLADQGADVYEAVFGTNVRAVFLLMQAEIKTMLATGGVIVNAASVSGVRQPNTGFGLYSASKAAVLSMTKAAAMEYAEKDIRINAVSPGRVLTPMMEATGIAELDAVAASLPARRLGKPEEVAEAVLWLASDASSFVFGHNLNVDGGFLAM
ncbi:SDR family NAD(P)-dependent oxidoreductase [Hoeflea sp.]|uniref:SDR family NAD(P)-dependent oxidoreductase n=1 Tax=Hoeflea sp. TaxID=1940281 RepID=UPI003B0124D6